MDTLIPARVPWVHDGGCQVCGARRSDLRAVWGDDEIRSYAVYTSEDPSCTSAGLSRAITERLIDCAFADAHLGCAVSCSECDAVIPLLEGHGGLVRGTDRTHAGTIRCAACTATISVVGVRGRLYTPPILPVGGIAWCGRGQGCIEDRCPLKGT